MSATGLTLALDQGSQSSRAILYGPAGGQLAAAKVPVSTQRLESGYVEQDADELVQSLRSAIDEVAATATGKITQIGLATQRSSLVCWNRNTGEVLSPVLSWQDRRAAEWLEGYSKHADRVTEVTGLLLSPHYGVSKMHWCLNHLPAVRACYESGDLVIAPLASYLAFALLDEQPVLCDPANAGRTLLYDTRSADWSDELLAMFGVPRPVLPDCVPSAFAWGHIEVAGNPVPVKLITGDQSAALFACGSARTDTVYANLGTGAFLQIPVGTKRHDVHGLLSSIAFSNGKETDYVLEGTVNGAGSAINVMAKEFGFAAGQVKDRLSGWLADTKTPPLFLNGVSGLGAPFWQADFPSQFVGEDTPEACMAAVLESIVFLLQVNFDVVANAGDRPERWVVTGGLSGVDGLCQRLADLSRVPVVRPDINEATALGVARLLNLHNATFSPEQGEMVFQPSDDPDLIQRYARWHYATSEVINTHCS